MTIFKMGRYVESRDVEYIKLTGAVKLYPVAEMPKLEISLDKIPEGQYKIGADIPAGEYKITTEGSGYYAVIKSSRERIFVTNTFMLKVKAATLRLVTDNIFKLKILGRNLSAKKFYLKRFSLPCINRLMLSLWRIIMNSAAAVPKIIKAIGSSK